MPVVDKTTFQSTQPKVFFGGDAAFGPKNIIWAVAHAATRRSRSTSSATARTCARGPGRW